MKKSQLTIFLLGALAGASLLCVTAFKFFHKEEAKTFAPKATAEFKSDLAALTREVQGKLVFERTGKDRDRLPDIYCMQLGDLNPTLLAKGGRRPKWSPDGRHILFVRNNDIMIMDEQGGNETRITTSGSGEAAAWFPDGKQIAFSDGSKARAVDLASGKVRDLLESDLFREMEVSPDGRFLAGTLKRMGGYTVRRFDLQTKKSDVLGKGCSPSFSPDGKYISNNRHHHVELHIREARSGKHVDTITAPEGYQFDNQLWSNHADWMTSVIEGAINEIFIHHIWDDRKTQVTALGDCDYPDLFVE